MKDITVVIDIEHGRIWRGIVDGIEIPINLIEYNLDTGKIWNRSVIHDPEFVAQAQMVAEEVKGFFQEEWDGELGKLERKNNMTEITEKEVKKT